MLLDRFGRPPEGLGAKSSETDPVSDADREAEAVIQGLLARERPDDSIVGEEGASSRGRSGRRWVVDPLDGTVNFLYGFPAWCVSVALEDQDGSLVGVVHDPVRGETFAAGRGQGAWRDGVPLQVRRCERLEQAMVATGFSYDRERRARQAETVRELLPRVRDIRRAGAAALDLAWLAAGRTDAYYERGLNPWDWAAGRLLVSEAGGEVAELRGGPFGLAAAAPPLLPQLLELVD